MLTLSHRFLHCHTDFPDCDTENELHNAGFKNKDYLLPKNKVEDYFTDLLSRVPRVGGGGGARVRK